MNLYWPIVATYNFHSFMSIVHVHRLFPLKHFVLFRLSFLCVFFSSSFLLFNFIISIRVKCYVHVIRCFVHTLNYLTLQWNGRKHNIPNTTDYCVTCFTTIKMYEMQNNLFLYACHVLRSDESNILVKIGCWKVYVKLLLLLFVSRDFIS